MRLEKKYEELTQADAKRMAKQASEDQSIWSVETEDPEEALLSEYIVAIRSSTTSAEAVADWVPVAQLVLSRKVQSIPNHPDKGEDDHESGLLLQSAVSLYCRELAQVAVLGSRAFATVPRNNLLYSVENTHSFYKHVYDNIIEDAKNEDSMTNAEAREILGLQDDTKKKQSTNTLDLATLKKRYRTLSMEFHPDRMIGQSEEAQRDATVQFSLIKHAYETLLAGGAVDQSSSSSSSSTVTSGSSWYESLGGRARSDFCKIEQTLFPFETAQTNLDVRGVESALVGLDPDLVQAFVARNSRRR